MKMHPAKMCFRVMAASILVSLTLCAQFLSGSADPNEITQKQPDQKDYMDYLIPDTEHDWYGARQDCKDRGMELIVLDTQAKHYFISSELSGVPEPFWIGGTDLDSAGNFYWDSTGEPFGYTAWFNGEPNNIGEERCVQMKVNDHYWNNQFCDLVVSKYICEVI